MASKLELDEEYKKDIGYALYLDRKEDNMEIWEVFCNCNYRCTFDRYRDYIVESVLGFVALGLIIIVFAA